VDDLWTPQAGRDYPGSTGEFQSWFVTDADCLDYLDWLRWPEGFVCPDLAQRWLLGTHQGRIDDAHLQSYLNEFVFRFNRRRSRSRGMVFHRVLELAVGHHPVRYRDLVANPQPKRRPPIPPGERGHPPSLDRPRAARPWRAS
jgi:hypothetical protein